ncbi:MAG: carboxypeptidase regulatory-like domain-containing protein, partial [Bacteroidetes bacterium]
MKGILHVIFACLLNISLLQGQSMNQVLRGTVSDKNSGQPLANVKVTLIRSGQSQETTASETGVYRLEQVAPGRYALMAEKDGYGVWVLSDLVVNAGKETILAIEMEEAVYQEDEVRITASGLREVKAVSTRIITVEETQRFAAAYFDPARVATSYPGVIQANDQANHLVVRGNTPNGLAWRLEGVDIVNPNHLSNAGTFTDRLTQNGGGTIILSTQLLGSSTLST